jgi:hypothetical protein
MMDGNLVFPVPPDDIIKNQRTRRWNYCGEAVYRGRMGAGGQWAAGEGVVDGAHGFHVVKKMSGFRVCTFFYRQCCVSGAKQF